MKVIKRMEKLKTNCYKSENTVYFPNCYGGENTVEACRCRKLFAFDEKEKKTKQKKEKIKCKIIWLKNSTNTWLQQTFELHLVHIGLICLSALLRTLPSNNQLCASVGGGRCPPSLSPPTWHFMPVHRPDNSKWGSEELNPRRVNFDWVRDRKEPTDT